MEINICSTTTETACSLIQYINNLLKKEPERVLNIAFSGGVASSLMYDLWANEFIGSTPWNRIHFWWAEESCVRPENSESNYGQMWNLLLNVAPIPAENIFRIKGENHPEFEVEQYANLVKKLIPAKNNSPEFDLILFDVDHEEAFYSILPKQKNFLTTPKSYAVLTTNSRIKRISLTGKPILNAKNVVFFITGENVSTLVKDILTSNKSFSASYIINHARNCIFFMDEKAASKLDN